MVIEHRQVTATPAAAVREVLDLEDASSWFQGALGELYAIVAAQKLTPSGPSRRIFANDLFTHERGEATIYVPCAEPRARCHQAPKWYWVPHGAPRPEVLVAIGGGTGGLHRAVVLGGCR